jgi:hypothetical protein
VVTINATTPVIPNSGTTGINGTGGTIPINTSDTPIVTLSFAVGASPVNVNATAYLLFHNSSLGAATYSIYFYEGATPVLWGDVDVPANTSTPVCLTKYFSAVSGTVNINLLCRLAGGVSDPAQTYTNPSITAAWS